MTVGENIRKYRKMRGMTQEDLRIVSGISISALRNYEGNVFVPRKDIMERIAAALSISPLLLIDIKADTVGEFAHYLFNLAEAAGIEIIREKDPETGKLRNASFSFRSPTLTHYLNEWADKYIAADKMNAQSEENNDYLVHEMLSLRAEELKKEADQELLQCTVAVNSLIG